MFKILAFSEFSDESGPVPRFCYPSTVSDDHQLNIAMKSISLLMGESVYQSGNSTDNLKYFGILPFPDIDMIGLVYFFLIPDKNVRGKAKAASISLLLEEEHDNFIYENKKTLRVLMDKAASKFSAKSTEQEISIIMNDLKDDLSDFNFIFNPTYNNKRKIKIVFTGLDNSGKTSFLKSIENKYSELMEIAPTKGIKVSERDFLGTQLLEWDFGGQTNYRINYIKNAEVFLSDIDLLFYIIDIQNNNNFQENYNYFDQILTTLENFKEFPPIILIFHKVDPDLSKKKQIKEKKREIQEYIKLNYSSWTIRSFSTTIFDPWTIISAFSYGISQLSPNRELFRNHLKWITKKMEGNASILLTKNAIVLSDYSEDWVKGKFFETSQSKFYNLFKGFEEFDLLHSNFVLWEIDEFKILLRKFYIKEKDFYILLEIKNEQNLYNQKSLEYFQKFEEKIKPLIDNYI